jgi:hypothetical protein
LCFVFRQKQNMYGTSSPSPPSPPYLSPYLPSSITLPLHAGLLCKGGLSAPLLRPDRQKLLRCPLYTLPRSRARCVWELGHQYFCYIAYVVQENACEPRNIYIYIYISLCIL